MKNLKSLILNNNINLISQIEQVYSELGEPDCKLINPYQLLKNSYTEEVYLEVWPDYTTQREVMISSSNILTIVEPKEEIIKKYLELTA